MTDYKFQKEIFDEGKGDKPVRISVPAGKRLAYIFSFLPGNDVVRDIEIELSRGAEVGLKGVFLGVKKDQLAINVTIHHLDRDSKANVLVKGILGGEAMANFDGLLKIDRSAIKSTSYLTENVLLGSGKAESVSKPRLEIDADDVSASHSTSMGKINSERLFYLQSRGLTKQKAAGLITNGFVADVVREFAPKAKENITRALNKNMKNLSLTL